MALYTQAASDTTRAQGVPLSSLSASLWAPDPRRHSHQKKVKKCQALHHIKATGVGLNSDIVAGMRNFKERG